MHSRSSLQSSAFRSSVAAKFQGDSDNVDNRISQFLRQQRQATSTSANSERSNERRASESENYKEQPKQRVYNDDISNQNEEEEDMNYNPRLPPNHIHSQTFNQDVFSQRMGGSESKNMNRMGVPRQPVVHNRLPTQLHHQYPPRPLQPPVRPPLQHPPSAHLGVMNYPSKNVNFQHSSSYQNSQVPPNAQMSQLGLPPNYQSQVQTPFPFMPQNVQSEQLQNFQGPPPQQPPIPPPQMNRPPFNRTLLPPNSTHSLVPQNIHSVPPSNMHLFPPANMPNFPPPNMHCFPPMPPLNRPPMPPDNLQMHQNVHGHPPFEHSMSTVKMSVPPTRVSGMQVTVDSHQLQLPPDHPVIVHQKDRQFVESFLRNLNLENRERKSKDLKDTISIPEAREMLKDVIVAMSEMSGVVERLKGTQGRNSSDVEKAMNEIQSRKTKIKKIMDTLEQPHLLMQLRRKVKKAKLKRLRLHKKKIEHKESKEEEQSRKEELHARIDAWRETIEQKYLDKERDKRLKKEADVILSEVRRKQSESSRAQQLLELLQKLRSIRKQAADSRGIKVTEESDVAFSETVSELQTMLAAQGSSYQAEERALLAMIQDQQADDSDTQNIQLESCKEMWHECLFGSKDVQPDDPLYPFWLYHTPAERELQALLQIRSEWDRYLVPPDAGVGSSVPVDWVIPCEPADDVWAATLAYTH